MNWQLIIGSGGLFGIIVMFFYVVRFFIRLENKINNVEAENKYRNQIIMESIRMCRESLEFKISSMGNDIFAMKKSIDEIKADLRDMNTKMEERTLKVIYTTRPLEEKIISH